MNRLPNRLHASSPTLNEQSTRQCRHIKKRKVRVKIENEFMANFIASLYCKALVVLGVAVPITDAITSSRNIFSFKIFYVYLYAGSIIFLLYMCFIQIREKPIRLSLYEIQNSSSPFLFKSQDTELMNQPVRYGSFYLRMGVTGFGVGSVLYAGFEFGQYFEYSSEIGCTNVLIMIKPFLRIMFVLMQIFFILSTNNFIHVQRSKMTARFGLMHMIATNLCEWFVVVVKETQHDIYKSAQKLLANNSSSTEQMSVFNNSIVIQTKKFYEREHECLKTNIIGPLLFKTEPYLAPCIIEYSVLCAVILGLMWRKNLAQTNEESEIKFLGETNSMPGRHDVTQGETKSRFSVDCSKAHKGLFSGILILTLTLMSIIIYSELELHPEYRQLRFLLVNAWEFLLSWIGCIASILCIYFIRDIGYYKMNRNLELEHLLLLISQSGIFIYNLFQIMGAVHMATRVGWRFGKIVRIITPLSGLLQSCAQTSLVLVAWRRRCIKKSHIQKKPGKQLITFLLLSNFSNWIFCRFNHNKSTSHPIQMDFYGLLSWNIITHVSIPLVLTYRFQSTVCFYEIWTHVYKTTPARSSVRDFREANSLV